MAEELWDGYDRDGYDETFIADPQHIKNASSL